MLLAAAAASICYWFVASVKHRLRLDDTLDVFGIHGLGGIVGSLGTAFVTSPDLWGYGAPDYSIVDQFLVQLAAVAIAILWSAAGSALAFWLVRRTIGLRVDGDSGTRGARPRRSWRARLQLLSPARRHSIGLAEGAGEGAQRGIAEPFGELGRRRGARP